MKYDKVRYRADTQYRERCLQTWRKKRKQKKQRRYFGYAAKTLRYKFRIQISAFDLWKIAKRQRLICPLTGRHLTRANISVDHHIARSKGGTSELPNLRFIDYHANLAKATFSDDDLFTLAKDIVAARA